MRLIALTTGDVDGIGCEISAKALLEIKIPKDVRLCVYLNPSSLKQFRKLPKTRSVENFEEAKDPSFKERIFLIPSTESPALWVEEVAKGCMKGHFSAMVTGPLSKPEIKKAGLEDLGHTDILKRISGQKKLWMSFWGSKFNVVLVTGHIPLSKVSERWTKEEILAAGEATRNFLKKSGSKRARLPLAVLGLNPHAGDSSLIGDEETRLGSLPTGFTGPLVPDAAFTAGNHKKYAAYLAAYHDQGLIPFKSLHGFDEGVHVTLGLPFLRSSVDHGPAKDIFGKGKARHGSMRDAINLALDYTKKSV